ncbi:MAG: hypothetical protein JWL76_1143 [Thermoleophilia bacterium]|nr:hypothetical protein [Thermoleophilia bacterium]
MSKEQPELFPGIGRWRCYAASMEASPGDAKESGATSSEDEYRRALRDYTQLMRHRLANPLTTIVSGIATLRERPDMEPDTRAALLDMMAEHASELERVALYPIVQRPEESNLVPMTEVRDGPKRRALLRERRKGMNEAQFRRINDMLIDLADEELGESIDFVCECSDDSCAVTIHLAIGEYESVHLTGSRFVVAPDHDDSSIEIVVEKADGWWTVEKQGIARAQAVLMHEVDVREGSAAPLPADS